MFEKIEISFSIVFMALRPNIYKFLYQTESKRKFISKILIILLLIVVRNLSKNRVFVNIIY